MYRSFNLEVIEYSDSDYTSCIDSRKFKFGYIYILDGAMYWRSAK